MSGKFLMSTLGAFSSSLTLEFGPGVPSRDDRFDDGVSDLNQKIKPFQKTR